MVTGRFGSYLVGVAPLPLVIATGRSFGCAVGALVARLSGRSGRGDLGSRWKTLTAKTLTSTLKRTDGTRRVGQEMQERSIAKKHKPRQPNENE